MRRTWRPWWREYDRRRRVIVDGLNRLGLATFEPHGAFYCFPRVKDTGMTSEEVRGAAAAGGEGGGGSRRGLRRLRRGSRARVLHGQRDRLEEALVRIERFVTRHGSERPGGCRRRPCERGGHRLECHAQLLTQSKMFCRCANDYFAAEPNTRVCPVCLGLPGALPVINERACSTVLTGLALNCRIPAFAKFDRKNYFYPDLVKGYQISQYDLPLCVDGWLDVDTAPAARRHAHHPCAPGGGYRQARNPRARTAAGSLIDYNRSGVPLMEIVSYHDMHTVDEVSQYIPGSTVCCGTGGQHGRHGEGGHALRGQHLAEPVGSTCWETGWR